MAVKTQAQIAAEIASLLADNTSGDISASDLRTVLNDLNDSAIYGGTKVYKALLTQSGTSAPVATVLENTLSGTPVWSYNSVGIYTLTLASEFPSGKVIVSVPQNDNGGISGSNDFVFYKCFRNDDNTISLYCLDVNLSGDTAPAGNGLLTETSITIEVYP